jgi:hypothetical protein
VCPARDEDDLLSRERELCAEVTTRAAGAEDRDSHVATRSGDVALSMSITIEILTGTDPGCWPSP